MSVVDIDALLGWLAAEATSIQVVPLCIVAVCLLFALDGDDARRIVVLAEVQHEGLDASASEHNLEVGAEGLDAGRGFTTGIVEPVACAQEEDALAHIFIADGSVSALECHIVQAVIMGYN